MPNFAEKIWDRERQRRNRKLEHAASVLGASLHDKVVPGGVGGSLARSCARAG
jgi:hypothetical protein